MHENKAFYFSPFWKTFGKQLLFQVIIRSLILNFTFHPGILIQSIYIQTVQRFQT